MLRRWLRGNQRQRLEPMRSGKASDPGRTAEDNRLFIEAVLWIAAPVAHGATCPRSSARGTACINALRDGRTIASAARCSPNWPRRRILSRTHLKNSFA